VSGAGKRLLRCGSVSGGAQPVCETVRGRGAELRTAGGQEIAGREAQETGERRQMLDLELEAAGEKAPEAPVAQPERPFNVMAQETGGLHGAG
jgi:hypothetical protein